MIYIIVGPSHAGKTSFTANSFIAGQECVYYKDIVGVTECETCYLIGNYVTDKRARGSDMVARQEVKFIADQIIKLLPNGKDIVLEGDKICSHPLLDRLKDSEAKCKLYYIRCSVSTSLKRNKAFNSTVKDSVIKRVATKAKNIYIDYYKDFDGELVDTDDITDFTSFSRYSKDVNFVSGYTTNSLF